MEYILSFNKDKKRVVRIGGIEKMEYILSG